jgi:hypothetical protein
VGTSAPAIIEIKTERSREGMLFLKNWGKYGEGL